jgi:hypothetical protein
MLRLKGILLIVGALLLGWFHLGLLVAAAHSVGEIEALCHFSQAIVADRDEIFTGVVLSGESYAGEAHVRQLEHLSEMARNRINRLSKAVFAAMLYSVPFAILLVFFGAHLWKGHSTECLGKSERAS